MEVSVCPVVFGSLYAQVPVFWAGSTGGCSCRLSVLIYMWQPCFLHALYSNKQLKIVVQDRTSALAAAQDRSSELMEEPLPQPGS